MSITSSESSTSSQMMTVSSDGSASVSLYRGGRTKKGVSDAIALVAKAFPKWTPEQSEVLAGMFAEDKFSDARMMAAVKHVIRNYAGFDKVPNIANFMQYDKRIKLYRHRQIDALVERGECGYADFGIAVIDGVSGCKSAGDNPILYALRVDAREYGVKVVDCKPVGGWED